jgi:hypothetical protein
MNSKKIRVIQKWATLTRLKEVQAFVEFLNFYRRFIRNFFKIANSLVRLSKKNVKFDWSQKCQMTFDQLKNQIIHVSILAHFNVELKIIIESDFSDYVSAEVLSQKEENEIVKSVVFFFKTLLSVECNYEIYDKELLVIVKCFEKWRSDFQSASVSIKILTDHRSLEYFMITKKLNWRQVRWVEFLVDFNFVIIYQAEKTHIKVNALTRRSEDRSNFEKDNR